jgi:hypothetical protein
VPGGLGFGLHKLDKTGHELAALPQNGSAQDLVLVAQRALRV